MSRKNCEHFWTQPIRMLFSSSLNRWRQQCLICSRWRYCPRPDDAPYIRPQKTRRAIPPAVSTRGRDEESEAELS